MNATFSPNSNLLKNGASCCSRGPRPRIAGIFQPELRSSRWRRRPRRLNFGVRVQPAPNGFTILEVMLAVMIFGIAVVGLLNALSTTIDTANTCDREGKIALSIQNQLAEAKEIDFQEGSETDGPDELGVLYTRDITPLQLQNEDGQLLDGIYSIKVTATWGLGGPDQTQTAEVYVYKP